MKKYTCFFIPSLILLLLTACIPGGRAFSPESAATQELLQDPEVISGSIRIHQTQSWRGSSIVMVSYLSGQNNEQMSCEAIFEMQRGPMGWQTTGSGIGCTSPPNTEPVTFGSGTQGVAPDDLSYAHGLVTLNAAEVVEVTWQDGAVQKAQVINDSFLALREGTFRMIARIEVFDKDHSMIYEIEIMPDVEKIP